MTINTDVFDSNGINAVFQTSKKYSSDTVLAFSIDENGTNPLSVVELGEDYIQITSTIPPTGSKIKIEYDIIGTLPSDNQEEYDLKERIAKLEKALENLYLITKAHEKALENRVNITAFQAWIRLIEKKTGIKLIDKNLGYISSELYK